MSDRQCVLIIDDAGQFGDTSPFEPEFELLRATNATEGEALLWSRSDIAIALINLNGPESARIALLKQIRARGMDTVVGIMIDESETDDIMPLCEAGADEIILRQVPASVHRIQLTKLVRMRKGCDLPAARTRANQLHAVIDGLTTGVGIFEYGNEKVRALYVNDAFLQSARLLISDKGDRATDALAMLPQREAAAVLAAMEDNRRNGAPIDLLFQIPAAGEQGTALRLRALPIQYEGHDTPVYLAHLIDVTRQYTAERALTDSNLKLTSLMNAVPGGIALYDLTAQPRLLYYNDVLRNMTGYTAEEYDRLMTENFHLLIDPRDRALMDALIADFRKNRQPQEAFFRALAKDGSVRWMRVNTAPIGQEMLCSAVYIDVTREKENEERTEQVLRELYHAAEHDPLTGITNREGFYRKTAELLKRRLGTEHVILMMDIDRFRVVNDMFGKEVGDRILIAIGQGMEHLLAPIGTCARMDSDHFVACFPQHLLDIDRIMRLVDMGLKRQNLEYHIQMSFGIYRIGDISVPVHQMCDRAMMALKTIKGNAVRHYAYYDEQLRLALLDENEILDEMYEALAQRQFQLYLQPIFSVESRQPVSAEVLVRWQHPVKGLIPPSRFIPLFERNGFITKLDLHIIEETCSMLAGWQAQGYPLPVSVNLSRIDLYSPYLTEQLTALLARYGVSPSQLRLELTESAYSKDPAELVTAINRLRAAGFAILMDDFGSGYSSLNVLMDMPVDALKLDMRFLAQLNVNPRAASILTSVVRMAKWLHMPVVAEGVETWEQLSFLRSIGCDHVQGYLFARPLPQAEYAAQYIAASAAPFETDLPVTRNSVDLSCLWDGSPQADTLFNGMIGAMGIYELVGGVLEVRRVNDGYYELFGCSPRQVFEGAREALFTVHPDDRPALMQACRKAAEGGRVERLVCRHVLSRDGRQPWLEARIRHLGRAGANDVFAFSFTDVTEQKEFEQTRTLRNYAMVLRNVYSSVFELNMTRGAARAVYIAGDQAATPDFEQPLDTLGQWLSHFLLEADEELTHAILTPGYLSQRVRESASGYYLLERRVCGDGREGSWASFTFIRVPTDDGSEAYLMCVADVDSRKRADSLLHENQWLQLKQAEQAHYQSLMEHLGTSLMEWEVHTGRVSASSGFDRFAICAFDFPSLTSHKDLEPYVYGKDLNVFRMFVNDVIAHGNAAVTLRLLSRAGEPLWCRVLCTLVTDPQGRAERIVAAIDRIDEQMKIRENYLDEQTRFQAFADNFLVGLGVFEVAGERQRILFLSNGYRSIVGYDETEPLYDDAHSFLGVHPEDIPRFEQSTREMLRTGEPYTIEYRVYHKDGRMLWMRSRNTVYAGAEPGHARIFAVIQDITELRTLQAEVRGIAEHLPAAVALYELGEAPRVRFETRRMAALTSGGTGPVPALGADALARIREAFAQGRSEFDEPMTLLTPDGKPLRVRVLAAAVPGENAPLCYCAVVPVDD